jgi:PAS domain S-box-containing protein
MDTDRNLLFGVLALQADLIDPRQFVEACLLWTSRKDVPLADLLVERGWILPDDRAHVDYLLGRKLQRHGGDPRASLAAIPDDVKRSLAAVGDDDIQRSLAELPGPERGGHQLVTVDHVPGPHERYARLRLHATGGIGRVWLARDVALGRDVALKELRPERAGQAALGARFLQEARITGQLEHPGIIPVYELGRGRDDQQPFYTMRFVKGRTLSEAAHAYHEDRLAGRADALELPALLSAFVTVCNTVAYAHSRGVIHRDLKGQNVILGDFGEVVVLDWGLAKLVGRPEGEPPARSVMLDDVDAASGYTIQGQALGTPAYMSPEQSAGRLDLIDRRTDVYGLGAILYEVLTGAPPFTGTSTEEVLRKVREEEPGPPRQLWPEVPSALEALCLRALAKRPADRLASAADLALEVQGWQEYERRKAEEALRESEALYHSLVENLPCCVFRKDLEGRFTFANQRFCEHMGRPLDQLLGKTDFDVCPQALAEKYRRDDRQVIDTGEVFEDVEEHQVVGGKGRCYVHTLKAAVRDAAGKVVGTQVIFWDVTARKRAEEELRQSRERFELAVRASQDGLWDWDVEANQVWYSPQMRKMLGYDEDEFPNRPGETEKRVHPEDHARWRATLHGHVEGLTDHVEMEYRIRHKDGSYRWVRDRGVALRRADGRAYRIAGSREDITERKKSEEALAHERHLLRCLLDTTPDKIHFKDRGGHYVRVNKALAEKLGLSDPAQALGKTVHDVFTAEYARQADADEAEVMRTGRPLVKDVKETWPDGRATWISTTRAPLHDPEGRIVGTFGISRDITERKRAEEALRESEERYRSVIAAMQDGIVLLDVGGNIRECNAAAERILGLSAEQIMGRTPHDPRWQAVREDGSPVPGETNPAIVTLRTGQPCTDVVMGVHKPDGTLTWITVNAQPLFQPDGRTLAGVVASFEDITDRKRTEELLRQTAEQLACCRQQLQRSAAPEGEHVSRPGISSSPPGAT